jgi:hypothetical protein
VVGQSAWPSHSAGGATPRRGRGREPGIAREAWQKTRCGPKQVAGQDSAMLLGTP